MEKVSFFANSMKPDEIADIPMDLLLDGIGGGRWQDQILPLRANKNTWDVDTYEKHKKRLPSFTGCGTFSYRSINGLKQHSGFIVMDVDGKDNPTVLESVEAVKQSISKDPFLYAAFVTAGGHGLALMFRIAPKKHDESFLGLQSYLFETYGIIIDRSCKDVSRLRFVSYDPYMVVNPLAQKFTKYLPTPPPILKKLPTAVWVESDFHFACKEIIDRRIDITQTYQDWYNIACAISEKMGAAGAEIFDALSQFHPQYNADKTARQYAAVLRHIGSGITIATFYYYCKQAGIQTISDRTRLIASTAIQAKKSGRKAESAVKILKEQDNIPEVESMPIIEQVFTGNIEIEVEREIQQVEQFLKQNHSFRRNDISGRVEMNGKVMTETDYLSIWRAAAFVFDKIKKEFIKDIIKSDFTPNYNPFVEFINENLLTYPDNGTAANIDCLSECIESDTFTPEQREYFLFKWLLGLISSIYGEHSPLMLIFSGEKQNTGKTEFFRRLLPDPLKKYYGEIQHKRNKDKDDNIILTQKLLLCDDEMQEKDKKNANEMKAILSTDIISIRRPYGEDSEDLKRLAVLCGTTNETSVLNDLTGNRRFIPINILSIDQEKYNSIDKTALFMELYWLYIAGHRPRLIKEDIEVLNHGTRGFEAISAERELLINYFRHPAEWEIKQPTYRPLTNTEIKAQLEKCSGQKLSANRLGQELKILGYEQIRVRFGSLVNRVYNIIELTNIQRLE